MKQKEYKPTAEVFIKTIKAVRLFQKHRPEQELTAETFQSFIDELRINDGVIPVKFKPPQKFICVKVVTEFEYDETGKSIDSVSSQGESVYYVMDEKLERYIGSLKPSFSC